MKTLFHGFLIVFMMSHFAYGSDKSSDSGNKMIEDMKSAGNSIKKTFDHIQKTGENLTEEVQQTGKKIKKTGTDVSKKVKGKTEEIKNDLLKTGKKTEKGIRGMWEKTRGFAKKYWDKFLSVIGFD